MAPFSRFQVSPYKNALPSPTPPAAHYFPSTPSHSAAVASSDDWLYVGSGAEVVVLGWDEHGKGERERKSWHAGVGEVVSLAVQQGAWLAVSGKTATAVFALPPSPFEAPAQLLSLPSAPSLSAHPTTPSFLLAHLSIFALGSDQPAIELEPWTDKGVWATCWSWDGRFVCGVGKDGSVGVWDPRSGTAVVGKTGPILNHLKPATCAALGANFLVTGFSKSRERIVLVIDPLSPAAPLATSVLDYETAPLLPLVDQDRSLVFLSGKGDSILKYAEFTKGAFAWSAVGLGAPVESLALAPWTRLDVVGKGEIDRLLVLSKQGDIVPVPVVVPQRFYIDFNEATNPPVRSFDDGQSSQAWLDGADALPRLVSRDPARREARKTTSAEVAPQPAAPAPATPSQPVAPAPTPAPAAAPAPTPAPAASSEPPTKQLESLAVSPPEQAPAATTASSPDPVPARPKDTPPAPAASTPPSAHPAASSSSSIPKPSPSPAPSSKPSATLPRWSRNFLGGSTPLIPAHDNLDYVSSSYPAEFPLLLATPCLFLFPVSGSGGRIAVHARQAKGRMPLVGDVKTLEVGTELVDLALDPVEVAGKLEVVTAGKDGKVKVWSVPRDGLAESVHETMRVVDAPGLDKVVKLAFSPTVKHLLAVVSNDFGEGVVRVVDTQTGQTLVKEHLNEQGVLSAAWNRSGTLLAIACRDRQIRVLDPREPSKVLAAPAFDSPRGFQLEWVDDTRIISVGHASGSMRKLQLHTVEGDALTVGGALSLDVSPAVLFPHFDPDTSILWLWCKGSSSVLAFDVHPENARQPFAQLPPFNAGSLQNGLAFLPKTAVDVKAVEVLTALRLTAREIQEVSWKVPRRHTDRFQDDVFPPTQGPPSLAADEWKAGQTPVIARIDLRPDGMELLSTEVLKAQPSAAKEKPKTSAREPTTAEKAQASMDLIFQKAKNDQDSDEEERVKGDEEWSD